MTAASIKSSVNVKSAGGDPRKVAANLAHDGDKELFSSTIGEAHGVGSKRESVRDPGTFTQALLGYFENINAETGEAVASKNGYLPDAIHDQVIAALDKGAGIVRFAFESYVVKGGTAGFTWLHEFKSDVSVADPVAEMRALLGKPKVSALPAPDKAKPKAKEAA